MTTNPKIDACLIACNSAFVGGAIACYYDGYEPMIAGPAPTITRNTILDNTSDFLGGRHRLLVFRGHDGQQS